MPPAYVKCGKTDAACAEAVRLFQGQLNDRGATSSNKQKP
jgi:hypothetical protein